MRLISTRELAPPPQLEVLTFAQDLRWEDPFPLPDQHHAILMLERCLPSLRAVSFAVRTEAWVRDHDVWTRDYHDVPLCRV